MNAALRHDPLPVAADQAALERAAALVAEADVLVIAAGAGMGADSGLSALRRSGAIDGLLGAQGA